MGNTQSVQATRGSDLAKYSGLFQLNASQGNTLKIISDVFEQLLTENNIFSLEQVLGSPEQCSALILILSKSMAKDFRTLQFPDPLQANSTIQVSYTMQKDYKELEKDPARKSLCGTLIFFMIRLVTLVAAIASSLQINREIVNILDLVKYRSMGLYNRRYKSPELDDVKVRDIKIRMPIPEPILESFKKNGLKQVMMEDNSKSDPRNLYFFAYNEYLPNTLVIDAEKSIAYFAKGTESTIYGLALRTIDKSIVDKIGAQRVMQYNQRAPPGMYGQAAGRHTRSKKSKQTKTRRMQRGGEKTVFSVTITKVFCKSGSACAMPEYYMEPDGTTYNVNDYVDLLKGGRLSIPSMTLQERIQMMENQSLDKLPVKEKDEEQIPEKFGPLSKVDKDTLTYFHTIRSTLRSKPEGTAPCFYRAFLLASRLDGTTLQTLICNDNWADKNVTSQVSYSLLHSLYMDRPDGSMDSLTSDEYVQMLNSFQSVFEIGNKPGLAPTLENMTFKQIPSEIARTICQTQEKGARSIREDKKKAILMNAHADLHTIFENHMKECVNLLMRVMAVETPDGYLSKPKIILDPVFVKDPLGSQHALEVFLRDARKLLSAHYLQVETVYQSALRDIVNLSRGDLPEPGTNILSQAANTLPNRPVVSNVQK